MRKKFGAINPIIVEPKGDLLKVTRAGKKYMFPMEEAGKVRVERRAMRGHCLVIDLQGKPVYFKQSEGAVEDAYKYIRELAQ